jgi:hypothetical protein
MRVFLLANRVFFKVFNGSSHKAVKRGLSLLLLAYCLLADPPRGMSQETVSLGGLIGSTLTQVQASQAPPLFVAGSGVPHAN